MKLLMVFEHYPVSTGRHMADALRRLGHDVKTAGKKHGTDNGWNKKPCQEKYIHEPDHESPEVVFHDWTPDVVSVHDPRQFPNKTGWRHPVYDVPHVIYCTCNNVCNMKEQVNAQHYFVAHKDAKAWPFVDDGSMTWLPNAYDPKWHKSTGIPFEKRRYDACFIGSGHTDRRKVADALIGAGLSVHWSMGEMYQEYNDLYNDSRLAIVTSTRGHSGASMRFFENAAQGCLVLAGPCADKFDISPQGFVWFETPREATERALYYLAHPQDAEQMIALSREWVKPHTWDARAKTFVEKLGGLL